MKFNRIIFLCLYTMAAFNGCRCKDKGIEPRPAEPDLNAYDYFPQNNDKQWVFEVYKTDFTLKPPKVVYAYDDTLYYEKDSNILAANHQPLYFKYYNFKKEHIYQSFLIGKYPADPQILYIGMYGINYTLFDLDNIKEDGTSQVFSTDGKPFDTRIRATYTSPLTKNYPTPFGDFSAISSIVSFNEVVTSDTYLIYSHNIIFAKNVGPVSYIFNYEYKNAMGNQDSIYEVQYKIKKVIN